MNKTFTIALLQALTIDVSAIRALQGLPAEVDDGFINITGFAQIDQNGQVRIDANDLHALALLLEEYEQNHGGNVQPEPVPEPMPEPNPVCDNEQTWNEHVINGDETVYDYLVDWFHNLDPPHECVTDDYRVWMLDYNDCHCAEIQRWMVENLEESDSTFQDVGEDVQANRPWMHDSVQRALFDLWDQCFPNWTHEVENQYTDDEITADVIRSLVPVESDICTGSHTPDEPPVGPELCPDGETDPAFMMEATDINWMLWHWFFQATIESEPTDWDCVLRYVFEESGSHCEVMRDTTADILDTAHLSWEILGDNVAEARPWMQPETVMAFERHWATCFPTFHDNWENTMTQEEKRDFSSDDIRNLVPEETW